jgi:hypothetical protein
VADAALTAEAPGSTPTWARLWTLDALRYRGSGWWLDRLLPHRPVLLLVTAFAIPLVWAGIGLAVTDDTDAYLDTHDVLGQLWFFPLHLVCVRVTAGLWAWGLEPSLDGLALEPQHRRWIRGGTLGKWASIGAIAVALPFMFRDSWFGLVPDPETGLNSFDGLWEMGALGRPVHLMMLGLWCAEWLLFGYLLWLQLWLVVSWLIVLRKVDFRPHLDQVLIGDGYRDMFTLLGKTATVSFVFALGNLAFIHYTGELIPRESVEIDGVVSFLKNMSDVLSTTLLFVLTVAAIVVVVTQLRKAMTRAVNTELADAGNIALAEMEQPLALTGIAQTDVERLKARIDAQGGLLRAVAFQHEINRLGGRAVFTIVLKSLAPIVTTILKIAKMKAKGT